MSLTFAALREFNALADRDVAETSPDQADTTKNHGKPFDMKTLVASLMMLGAATAFANEAADERHNRLAFQGATARAAVQADYLAARANGTLPDTGETASLRAQTPWDRPVQSRETTPGARHAWQRARA